MSCSQTGEYLSCLLDGELDAIAERRLLEHLAVCASCRTRHDRFRQLSRTLRRFDRSLFVPPDGVLADRVLLAARKRPGPAPARRAPGRLRPLAAAAALLLLAGLAAGYLGAALRSPAVHLRRPAENPALAEYRARAGGIAPGDAGAHLVLARWCLESGLPELATREYLRALGADPSREEVRAALATLLPRAPGGGAPVAVALPDPPDPGPALPARAPRPAPLSRAERLARLGIGSAGGRHLTEEARRRLREIEDGGKLLAAAAERRNALLAKAGPSSAVEPVIGLLAAVSPADEIAQGNLRLVPVRGGGRPGVAVLGVERALADGVLEVTEDETDGRLSARNRDPSRYVFLAAGQILVGGQQDRLVIRDVLLPPKSTDRVPVVCCERGRSTGPGLRFGTTAGIAPPAVREILLGAQDQHAVWATISGLLAAADAGNPTDALRVVYEKGRGPRAVKAAKRALEAVLADDRTVGFLAFAGGRFLGAEIFSDHQVFRALGGHYLASYVLGADAVRGKKPEATRPEVRALLDSVTRAAFYHSGGPGSGEETEFVGRDGGVSGHALVPVAGARPLHVTLLPGEEKGRPGDAPPPSENAPSGGETGHVTPPPPPAPRGRVEDRRRKRRESGLKLDPSPGKPVLPGGNPSGPPRPPAGGVTLPPAR